MKKIFFVLVMLLSTCGLMAQVKFENCTLKEAFEKAKAEKKLVMVVGSAIS